MIKTITLSLLLFCGFYSRGQYPGYTLLDHPETAKKFISAATSATGSIQSDFSQEKTLTMLSEKINATGKFWFRKNDKLRMEYLRPYQYLMILNGGKIYIKDAQKENKLSAGSNRVFKQVNRILIDCVSGNMLENADFKPRLFESPGSFLVELKPIEKNLTSLYQNINIIIDKKDFTPTAIEMYEISGDKTIIRFQNKLLNVQIPDSVFFIP